MLITFAVFLCSWCGYGNGLSFKEIGETDIEYIENFVRNELEKRLLEISERKGKQFDECEKEFFFGIYASSISEFKFLRGERIQILAIADILRKFMDKNGVDAFKQEFEPPKTFKISKAGTIKRQAIPNKNLDSNELCSDLLPKLKRLCEKQSSNPLQPIDEKIVNIVTLENGFRADVLCVFCPINDFGIETKKFAVQYDKNGNWNLSNLSKHLKRHITNKKHTDEPSLNDIPNELRQESTPQNSSDPQNEVPKCDSLTKLDLLNESQIMSMPIYCEENEPNKSNLSSIKQHQSNTMQLLYQQFAAQNLKLIRATMTNNETKKFVAVIIDGRTVNLNTLDIKTDGNCMFGSLAHQQYCVKTNSKEHNDLTAKLRKDVVQHILTDFDQYKRAIEIDFRDSNKDDAGKEYISTDLSKNGEWGGSETLLAVSNMFKVNILVFREHGPFCCAFGFNRNFDRTVFLAYRICGVDENGAPKYNHYESVCAIDEELLYKCAQYLGSKMDQQFDCK